MPNIPLKVWLGGMEAPIVYQGRSGCCIGVDQVAFTVPASVPAGCAVPLVVQINNQVSNSTALPVGSGSRTCPNLSIPGLDISQLSRLSSITLGDVELDHLLNDNGSGYVDRAGGFFATVSGLPALTQAYLPSYLDNAPIGTCTVIGAKAPSDVFFNNLVNNGNVALVDAGSSFTIAGSKGSMTIQPTAGNPVVLSTSGAFLAPGAYTLSGNGGKDVGAFTAQITIPVTPVLTSPTGPNGLTITRAKGTTVSWNPNGSTGHVEVVISAFVDQNTGAQAICTAPASAGTLTVPPYVLLAPPATNGANFNFQPGDQGGAAFDGTFTAPGITIGIAQTFLDAVAFGGFVLN